MPSKKKGGHSHRSTQKQVKKQHNKKKGAGPNQNVKINGTTPATSSAAANIDKLGRKNMSKTKILQQRMNTERQAKAELAPKLIVFIALHDSANPTLLKRKCIHTMAQGLTGGKDQPSIDSMKGIDLKNMQPYQQTTIVLPSWAQASHKGDERSGLKNKRVTLLDVPTRDKFQILDACKAADLIVCCFGPQCSIETRAFDDLGYDVITCLKSQGVPLAVGAIQGLTDDPTLPGELEYRGMIDEFALDTTHEWIEPVKGASTSSRRASMVQRQSQMIARNSMSIEGGLLGAGRPSLFDPSKSMTKKKRENSKLIQRFFLSEFCNGEKIFECDTDVEVNSFIRHIGNCIPKELSFRKDRGYMTIDRFEHNARQNQLAVCGYIRGNGFSSQNFVHITNVGDFAISKIETMDDPVPARGQRKEKNGVVVNSTPKIISERNVPIDMARLMPFDPTQLEQQMPTDAEIRDARRGGLITEAIIDETSIPDAGENAIPETLLGIKRDAHESKMNDDDAMQSDAGMNDNASEGSDYSFSDLNEELFKHAEECPTKKTFEFEERAREDLEFPDEVDTPLNIEARERFQRYRGLRSFKTSPWDAYEELPTEYSRIWEFENFRGCQNAFKRVQAKQMTAEFGESGNGQSAISGRYCLMILEGVSAETMQKLTMMNKVDLRRPNYEDVLNPISYTVNGPIVLSQLFDTERKVSVVHLNIHRVTSTVDTSDDFLDQSYKSKMLFEFHCGFRKFLAKPIFSQVPKKSSADKDKHMFQRYLHPGQSVVASFYAPVIFTPCPVMMFQLKGETDAEKEQDFSILSSNFGQYPTVGGRGRKNSRDSDDGMDMVRESDNGSILDTSALASGGDAENPLSNVSRVLTWRKTSEKYLVAWGEAGDANPRKLIIKRCILTGYPFRVHKNKAVVRHMFFKPEDIKWFKPVELRTKHGLRGNIKESLGTHGYMKCVFGDRMKQDDTVCMDLYKRQYPIWYPPTWGGNPNHTAESEALY